MRHSTAILSGTAIRLWDLAFPARRVHISRTRLVYIHLDNLLNFAKIDRDGRVDGFLAAYLPNELAVIFFRRGEAVTDPYKPVRPDSLLRWEVGRDLRDIPIPDI